MIDKKIRSLIEQYEEPGDFTHVKVTDNMVVVAEHELGVKLPGAYIEFLKLYGHGGICGVCTNGICLDNSVAFVEDTLEYRNEGLPLNLVVIENVGEWLFCIDTSTGKVVSWDMSGNINEDYDNFEEYLISQMNDAIENM